MVKSRDREQCSGDQVPRGRGGVALVFAGPRVPAGKMKMFRRWVVGGVQPSA